MPIYQILLKLRNDKKLSKIKKIEKKIDLAHFVFYQLHSINNATLIHQLKQIRHGVTVYGLAKTTSDVFNSSTSTVVVKWWAQSLQKTQTPLPTLRNPNLILRLSTCQA